MIELANVSIWVIVIAAVIQMAGGAMWYGPLFGKAWMKGMGIDPNDKELMAEMQKSAGPAYGASLVFAIIFGYAIDLLFNHIPIASLTIAIFWTLLLYVAFTFANTIKGVLWGEISKSVFIINTGFEVVFFLIVGVCAYLM
ncbi:DUF1761 domain-containing protein [Reinekea marina]|uniref:DUF1761 domain-containing protein n=1 Tax=Reinekea marina TaxID=1310421 RepID=A0ABV7WQS0_9GAMM|nr:DUF1761 domain-containing protein [Reinekea marina]MDN3648214.1 DUF1761 domain-containing protein [Reinekea marina]